MSKQFTKLVNDTELYDAICEHMVAISLPKREKEMTLQDYGALIEAHTRLLKQVQSKLDSMHLIGQEHLDTQ